MLIELGLPIIQYHAIDEASVNYIKRFNWIGEVLENNKRFMKDLRRYYTGIDDLINDLKN